MFIYVYDLIVTGNSLIYTNQFIESLSKRLSLKDLEDLSFFLGIEVTRNVNGIHLTQTRYIADLLHMTQMESSKLVSTPMCPNTPLTLHFGSPLQDPMTYRAILGSLQYLSLKRPHISFSVNKISQFMQQPNMDHWNAVKRVLLYLA